MADLDGAALEKMTDSEYKDFMIGHMLDGWIPMRTYQLMFPSESKSTIEARIAKGVWFRGVHIAVPAGSHSWVNLKAIRAWVTGQQAPVGPL